MLRKFADWFASAPGVWQTAVIVLAWWFAEFFGLMHDPQHLQLCVWLTIYSGVTQPVLGYVNRLDSTVVKQILDEIRELAHRIDSKEDREISILEDDGRE